MRLVDRALAELPRLVRAAVAPRVQHAVPVEGLRPEEAHASGLPDGVGLYVHVPFCKTVCRFCPYNKTKLEAGRVDRYTKALYREMDMLAPLPRQVQPASLYFGGGTPTLLPDVIEEVVRRSRSLGLRGEAAVEVYPRHAEPGLLARLRGAGIDYVSIGVQSFDDRVLQHLGRGHSAQEAIRGLEAALAAGFSCVDADLMFDVGNFGEDGVVYDAEIAFHLGVDQLSVYPMMRFDCDDAQHDEPAEKRALHRIAQVGEKRGYTRTSVWTFGRDSAHRYSSITRERYVGLGPSGSSFLGDRFFVNTFDVDKYAELVESGRLPIVTRVDLDRRAGELYDLFWRCYEGYIDPQRFSDFRVPLAVLALAGVVGHDGAGYRLTERGFDLFHSVERWVTYQFIKPLWAACRAKPIPALVSL